MTLNSWYHLPEVVCDRKIYVPAVNYASNDFSDIKSLLQILSHDSVKLFWVVLWWLDSLADGTVRLLQRKIIIESSYFWQMLETCKLRTHLLKV